MNKKMESAAEQYCEEYNLRGEDETVPAKMTFRAGWRACEAGMAAINSSEILDAAATDIQNRPGLKTDSAKGLWEKAFISGTQWAAKEMQEENTRLRAALESAKTALGNGYKNKALSIITQALEQ